MTARWDVIVVGAGPAGCAAALQAAHGGLRVLVLDRHDFPRNKACAGAIPLKEYQRLRLPPALVTHRTDNWLEKSRRLTGGEVTTKLHDEAFALTVRRDFDHAIWRLATRTADFQVIQSIDAIEEKNGILALEVAGQELSTRVLIGTDGARSRIRGLINPPATPSPYFAVEGVLATVALERRQLHFFMDGPLGGYGWAFPKQDHWNIGLYTTALASADVSKQALQRFAETCLGTGTHVEAVIGAAVGATPAANLCKGQVLLAGDAMGIADPLYGGGIVQAIDTGMAAAQSAIQHIRSGAPLATIHHLRISGYLRGLPQRQATTTAYYRDLKAPFWQ